MANKTEMKKEGRKAWTAPELRRLRAGSAEQGTASFPDGGGPGNARS